MAAFQADIAVIGAGAVGLAAAVALAREGFATMIVGPLDPVRDGRTAALLDGSVDFLKRLGAWPAIEPAAAPLAKLRIVDDTGSLFRAPPLSFSAEEIGLEAFGFNIENATLVEALKGLAAGTANLLMLPGMVEAISLDASGSRIRLADGTDIGAKLIVGADGRHSPVRRAAAIPVRSWSYPQLALTTILGHERPHHDTSTEFHTRAGPFTLAPLPGARSSLVWVASPSDANHLASRDDRALELAIEGQAHAILGPMRIEGPRGCVRLGGLAAARFTAAGVALVGEAAHVLPPIGAQGLNLGLRDVAGLRDALVQSRRRGRLLKGAALRDYEAGRLRDAGLRIGMVDALNRSLLARALPVDLLRGLGMLALGHAGPLRRAVMRQGLGPARAGRRPG